MSLSNTQRIQREYIISFYEAPDVLLKGYVGITQTGLATNL